MPQNIKKTVKRSTSKNNKNNLIARRITGMSRYTVMLVAVLVFAVIGAVIVSFSSAEDPSSIAVGITKTQYAYPANAVFVSPSGNNSATGSKDAPLQTLQAAVDKASAGSTIVMRAGTYREALKTLAKQLTIQPYPNEEVWLDGSDPITGWVQDGTAWRKDGWTVAASLCPNNTCYDANLVTPQNPAAGLPDMLFVGGNQLRQVLTRAEVTDGTFYVDRANSQIFMGTNPSGKTIEASTRKQAIMYYSAATAGSKLRGIGVRRYASNLYFTSKPAQIEVSNGAKGIEFENMTFTQSSANGLFLTGSAADKATGIVVRNSIFASNGASGLSGNYTDGLQMENNIVYNNNTEKGQWEGEYGSYAGTKIARMTNSTIKNNLFQDNYGTGFWCDLDCSGNTIVGNMARGNVTHGIFYEVSYNAIIASNVSYNNGVWGFKINGRGVKVFNNTAYNNASDNYFIYDDSRLPSQNIEVKNNISAGGPKSDPNSRLIFARLNMSTVGNVVTAMDSNVYFRSSATQPKYLLGWQGTNINASYTTLDANLRNQTGREAKALSFEGKPINALFKDVSVGNFQLVSGTAVVDSSEPLPADVAQATGQATGQVVSRGAITWKNGSSNVLAYATPDPVVTPTPPANVAPVASVTLSTNSLTAPATFQVTTNASDADGAVTKLEILQNGAVVFTCYNKTDCRYDASGYGVGTFQYAAKAYDNASPTAVTVSSTQSIVVNAPAAPPVVVPAPVPALTKPSNIKLGVDQSFLSVGLGMRWDSVVGATGYKVTPTGRTAILRSANTFTDAGINLGNIYTYDIVAINGSAESPKTSIKTQVSCGFWIFNCKATLISIQ